MCAGILHKLWLQYSNWLDCAKCDKKFQWIVDSAPWSYHSLHCKDVQHLRRSGRRLSRVRQEWRWLLWPFVPSVHHWTADRGSTGGEHQTVRRGPHHLLDASTFHWQPWWVHQQLLLGEEHLLHSVWGLHPSGRGNAFAGHDPVLPVGSHHPAGVCSDVLLTLYVLEDAEQ